MQKITESYRLFFALWPDTGLATDIYRRMAKPLRACTGRRIPAHHLHITLAFIGSVDVDRMHCVQQAAARISTDAFDITLDRLGYWSRPQIVWLAPTEIPPPLIGLQADLSRVLAENCGYQPETRPFWPHFSLMRKVRRGPDETGIAPVVWQVKQFSLLRSHTRPAGVEYEVLNNWSLRD